MFGSTTAGIIVDDFNEFMVGIAEIMVSCDEDEREMVAEDLININQDSMGLQKLIY
jgi:hypothetical protein